MKYIIGSLSTLLLVAPIVYFIFNKIKKINTNKIIYSQSRIHKIISPFLPDVKTIKNIRNSQSKNHIDRTNIKVIIIDNAAYWIKDNAFYMAEMHMDGSVDKDTTRIVDIMTMDSVELDKMLFIMDKLREGLKDDSGGTGQQ